MGLIINTKRSWEVRKTVKNNNKKVIHLGEMQMNTSVRKKIKTQMLGGNLESAYG